MDILSEKSDQEMLKSLIAETAKAQNEIKCAQRDLEKAQNRVSFCLVLLNNLINRDIKE